MTPEDIEDKVNRMCTHLVNLLNRGEITHKNYTFAMKELLEWKEAKLMELRDDN